MKALGTRTSRQPLHTGHSQRSDEPGTRLLEMAASDGLGTAGPVNNLVSVTTFFLPPASTGQDAC